MSRYSASPHESAKLPTNVKKVVAMFGSGRVFYCEPSLQIVRAATPKCVRRSIRIIGCHIILKP
jgi:hypothetical protein